MDLSENKGVVFRHPWELSRSDMLLKELNKLNIKGDILDVGCGDSFFDKKILERFSNINSLYGIDINLKEEQHSGKFHYINNYDKIKNKKFDFILLMDIIEHVEDDINFLGEIKNYLKPGGIIFITVPAFQFVFGYHDIELKHYRRYNIKQLQKILYENNIKIKNWNYFYVSLLLIRIFTKNKDSKSLQINTWKESENNYKTKIIRFILNADFIILQALSKIHINIGGLSLLAVCKKNF